MKMWKRVLSVVLASVMVLGLCACNKEDDISAGSNEGGAIAENTGVSPAKEYIYNMEAFDLSALSTYGDCSLLKLSNLNDMLYMVLRTNDESGNEKYQLAKMNMDGSDLKIIEMQLGEDKSVEKSEETDDAQSSVYEYTGFDKFAFKNDVLYALKTYTYEDYSDASNYININENYVCCWDLEGNLKWESFVELNTEDTWSYISSLTVLPSGNAALLISGSENGIIEVSKEGDVRALNKLEELAPYFANSGYTVETQDGRILLTYYVSRSWSETMIMFYDFRNDSVTASFPMPETITYSGMNNLLVTPKDELVYTNSQGVFKYHIGDAKPKQLMSYINSDLNTTHLDGLLYLDDTQFIGFYTVYDDVNYTTKLEGGLFTKVEPENVPDKEMLVLGTHGISNELKRRVVDFNKSSETHRIIIKDYNQYITDNDYMAGYTQLNTDIISGNMPDILVVDAYNMSLGNYASKGLLADIGELIAKDDELSKNEYMSNVFEACKINGKLYEIIPSFYISTYLAKESLVGDCTEWTMKDAEAVVAKMPEGAQLFSDMTRAGFISIMYEMCGGNFVDVSTGKCSFDSKEFIEIMEYANSLPEEIEESGYWENWYNNYESQYRENRTLLATCYLTDMEGMVYTINGNFGEDVSFIGLPSSLKNGSAVNVTSSYALSAKSENLDVAWDFMKYYLTDEYQNSLEWQLPVSKAKFDTLVQKTTKNPVIVDENGNETEGQYVYWINDQEVVLEPLTQEQADNISTYVSSVTTRSCQNLEIRDIMNEELAAYFEGQKSAEEVAGLIQNRVQLMVNENR